MTLEEAVNVLAEQRNMTLEQYFDYCSKAISPEYAKVLKEALEKLARENKAEK